MKQTTMQYRENIQVALRSLADHKFRSFLTMLGIIFGVASVIAMLSIGEGAKREAIAKYKDLGVNNIIVREKDLSDDELEEMRARFSPGLSLADADDILAVVPDVDKVVAQAELTMEVKQGDRSVRSTVVGVTPGYTDVLSYSIGEGDFLTDRQCRERLKVCVLGAGTSFSLFGKESPLGRMVKMGDQWFEVVGVLDSKAVFTETVGELAARDLNTDVFIPLTTLLDRFPRERSLDSEVRQLTIHVTSSDRLMETSRLVTRILDRHHWNNADYNIVIPYELLKQEEKERQIYNFLLGAIAAISLIVGGIGIMNIMLANVMERTREIGIRRAIGARKRDIMSQFVAESVVISVLGGLIGVALGIALSLFVNLFTDVATSIRLYSIIIAFTFSVLVGICFGYLPAKNAAGLKPVDSIRYE